MVELDAVQPYRSDTLGGARPRRSLVTGGSGFLGSYLVAALTQAGDSVCILDPERPHQLPQGAHYVAGSVTDPAAAWRALKDVDCVYHLAAIAHLWRSLDDDFDRTNRLGTEVMLAAAKEMGIPRFVHCSSYTTLLPPVKSRRPINEILAIGCEDLAGPYSRSKYLAEEASQAAAAAGQNVVIVNPTILVGANDRNFSPGTAMLLRFIRARMIFYLETMLNIVHVQDVARGLILAAVRGRAGERYLLGGEDISLNRVLDLLDRISGCAKRRVRVSQGLAILAGHAAEFLATHLTRRTPSATAEGVQLALRSRPIDLNKARRELGYEPRSAELALTDAIQWILSAGNRTSL
jgi:dihydroflavonol-4-reductase